MISDEERREVAARLSGERKGSLPEFIAKAAFGVDYAKGTDMLALPKRLADLIDRPTCEMKYHWELSGYELYPTQVYECGACGHFVEEGRPDYCPNCGREVVS